MRQAEREAAAERARLRAAANPLPPRTPLSLRTAAFLRLAADHLESRAVRTA
jgi:hypothetical protein